MSPQVSPVSFLIGGDQEPSQGRHFLYAMILIMNWVEQG